MTKVNSENSAQASNDDAQSVVKAETASPSKRNYRTLAFQVALFAAIGAFAVLTLLVTSTPLFAMDLEITRAVQSITLPLFAAVMKWISWPGFLPQSILIPVFAALVLYRLGLQWEAVTTLVAGFLPGLVNVLVKELIRRPRPGADLVDVFSVLESYSFPSGHVMFYTGFFGFLWFVIYSLFKSSWKRTLLLGVFGALIILVGVSRIYLGHHWASDILGAFLLGGLTLAFILQFYRWGKKRFLSVKLLFPDKSNP